MHILTPFYTNDYYHKYKELFKMQYYCIAMFEEERQRIESLTVGWDDPTQVNWGEAETAAPTGQETVEQPAAPLYKCTALYSYTVRKNTRIPICKQNNM